MSTSNLAIVYQYFTLQQWIAIADSIRANKQLSMEEKLELLTKLPSAAL